MKKLTLALPLLFLLNACDNSYSPKELANTAASIGACPEAETIVHDFIQQSYEKTGEIPPVDEVISEFENSIASLSMEKAAKGSLSKSFRGFYSELENQVNSNQSKEEVAKSLGQLEYGTHPDKSLQKSYTENFASFKSQAVKSLEACNTKKNQQSSIETIIPDTEKQKAPFFEELKAKTENLSQYGALKSFSVAYQSCEAISINPVDRNTESMSGVEVVGRHSSGRGNKREITNLSKVQRTHPYIKNYRKPASNCVDSTQSPLIYDFGGKPYATSDSDSSLNFFKSAGSGSKELGVDCSGYVFTSLMSAGLKLDPDKPLRARSVNSIPARSYKNPGSKMSCIEKVKAGTNKALQPGDIFASNGHMFIVNIVGQDPLGVEKAFRENKCSSISYKDFNFTILQSSPTKGAIGMNHMEGSDYLRGSSTMRKGFEKFARLDCENKRRNKISTPDIDEASLVRHKMTSECIAEGVIKMDNESCVERCSYNR